MRRSPMPPRSKPMTRTGINRTSNRSCSKSTGPRVVKPRARIKSKPLTRSKEWKAYSKANPDCELTRFFPEDHPIHPALDFRGLEIHHILWGQADRVDIPTNLIRVTAKIHDWQDANKRDGLVLCLWCKSMKGELDWSELERIGGRKKYPGSLLKPTEAWLVPYWTALINTNTKEKS